MLSFMPQDELHLCSASLYQPTKWDHRAVLEARNHCGPDQGARRGPYHVGEEVGGMFTEADDTLPQLVSPQAVGEGPQLPLHLWP